ncbi:DUF4350 domain-containing protein [Mucilaginibacter sp. UR6-11]|uniref:DUF4350 domain-containing protein n=1 Tax=Mucilaginibacter sp. UR6-11 TaxID=1435644 RepID=UPI001E54FFCD|nr:DUF4350 domain-containing protein [Mucilaginibacter sp. UR6-11]MCC8425205.1 DUF4350 domain-containing protein [Mucilaginibacter sp. UR6-11]
MKDFKIYLIAASLLLTIYVVIQFNKPVPVNWAPTLSYADKIPFGTFILYNRLKDLFPGAEVTGTTGSLYNVFSKPLPPGNYIIIARQLKVSKIDFEQLVKYVQAGNHVFMSGFNWDGFLKQQLKIETGLDGDTDKVHLNFTNPRLNKPRGYIFTNDISRQYFSKFDTAKATVISKNGAGEATFLSYKFGNGTLLLCATPEIFSNYSLLTPQGAEYAALALSYLPPKQHVFWDLYQNHDVLNDQSPVGLFLDNPSLQWAYYLSLFTLFIYIVFEVKRRQRVIPVIEPLKNATIDFVGVVGKVYYEKRDNANIAGKKIRYLLNHLREKYQLKTNKPDDEFIENLIHKTGTDPALARELVSCINYLTQKTKVTDRELIVLNQLIEKFYSQS